MHEPARGEPVKGYVIEKGIQIPPRFKECKYPFDQMEIGDSFAVPAKDRKAITDAAHAWGSRHGKRFRVRLVAKDQYRVWRVEPKPEKAE